MLGGRPDHELRVGTVAAIELVNSAALAASVALIPASGVTELHIVAGDAQEASLSESRADVRRVLSEAAVLER